ncbi:hypothetical protein Tco_0140307 [Tanacetum coccineum]
MKHFGSRGSSGVHLWHVGKDMSEWMSISAKLEGIGADALIEKFKNDDDGVKTNIHSWFVISGGGSKDMETD